MSTPTAAGMIADVVAITVPIVGDVGTPPGVAFLAFTQAGPGPADLIDASAVVTDVRVETLR